MPLTITNESVPLPQPTANLGEVNVPNQPTDDIARAPIPSPPPTPNYANPTISSTNKSVLATRDLVPIIPSDTINLVPTTLPAYPPTPIRPTPRHSTRLTGRPLKPTFQNRLGEWVTLATEAPAIAHLPRILDPATMEEAISSLQSKEWSTAMDKEIASLKEHGTWDLVDLPIGRRPVGVKWVFKVKYSGDGILEKFKARLVAKGYLQRKGVDYEETYAPVARMTSMRVILAIAAHEGLRVEQMDVNSAYLNGWMDTEVFMRQPPGYIDQAYPNRVCKLNKGLYGLKQAGRIWYEAVHSFIEELGFLRTTADPCVYTRTSPEGRVIVGLHVDDFVLAGQPCAIDTFRNEFRTRFSTKELGEAKYIVGLQISQSFFGITVSQSTYIKSFVQDIVPNDTHTVDVPLAGGEVKVIISAITKGEESPPIDKTVYKHIVGKTMYAMVGTRPDIAFAVGFLGRYAAAPNEIHLKAALDLISYLRTHSDHSIYYPRGEGVARFHGYVDADWGGAEDRKSTGAFIFMLGNSPISWQSKRQNTVALSSTEAEYIATKEVTKEAIWLRRLFADLGHPQDSPTTLYEDNTATIALARNPRQHNRTKHIDIQYHFIREYVANNTVKIEHIESKDQLADLLTKGLNREKFNTLFPRLGLTV
jgi:hypothetical protein